MEAQAFLDNFATIADAPGGVERLRDVVLELAVLGQLVPQNPADEQPTGILESAEATARPTRRTRSGAPGQVSDAAIGLVDLPGTWLSPTAGQLGYLIRGVSYPKSAASALAAPGTVPLLRAHNIDGSVNHRDLVYVPEDLVKESQQLVPGDHLICMSSGSERLVGKSALVTEAELGFSFGAFCSVFRPAILSTSPFLGVVFKSPWYRKQISLRSRGIGINNLRAGDIEQLLVPLPPAAEQARIVAKVDELLGLCDNLELCQERCAKSAEKLAIGLTSHLVGAKHRSATATG